MKKAAIENNKAPGLPGP